jgi:hypothetical protein
MDEGRGPLKEFVLALKYLNAVRDPMDVEK